MSYLEEQLVDGKLPSHPKRGNKRGPKPKAKPVSAAESADVAMKKLRRKTLVTGKLSREELNKAKVLVQESKNERMVEFLGVFDRLKDLSDEELAQRLSPYLGPKTGQTTGRPASQPPEITDEKRVLAWRLHRRNLTSVEVAKVMGMSVPGVAKLLAAAKDNMRVDPDKIDIPAEIGQTLNFYEDVRGMALAIASNGKSTQTQKLGGMNVALQAERDRIDYMKTIGVYTPQMTSVMQTLVIGSLKLQMGQGEHDMGKAVNSLAKMLMSADLSQMEQSQQGLPSATGKVYDVQVQPKGDAK